MRAALCVLMLALAVWPLAARADDYGPRRDVAAIRHDLPLLQSGLAMLENSVVQSLVVESAVVDGEEALVQWRDTNAGYTEIVTMRYRYSRWWLEPGRLFLGHDFAGACPTAWAPTPQFLLGKGVPPALATSAGQHMPVVQEAIVAVRQFKEKNPNLHCGESSTSDPAYSPFELPFQSTYRRAIAAGDYGVRMRVAKNDGSQDSKIAHIQGRAPTEAESWANQPSGNSYFYFSGTVESAQPVHVQAGMTVDVWFPFVLDPSLSYSLTIAAPHAMSLGPVQGALKDNTLHFVLPAFTAPPVLSELMGEIEGEAEFGYGLSASSVRWTWRVRSRG